MKKAPVSQDGRKLEDEFFARENARLLAKLRGESEKKDRREALGRVLEIRDEALLDRLLQIGIGPETALALRLIPLIYVAWADGAMDDRERRAILKAAANEGVGSDEAGAQLLSDWLARRPEASLLEHWKSYVGGISKSLAPGDREKMKVQILGAARQVAESAGGILGLTSKTSAAERKVLEDLEKILG